MALKDRDASAWRLAACGRTCHDLPAGSSKVPLPPSGPRAAFGAEHVPNHEINRPTKKSSETLQSSKSHAQRAADKAKNAAEERIKDGGPDHDVNDQLEQNAAEGAQQGFSEGTKDKHDDHARYDDSQGASWNPLKGGAKTSTLHFSTVLFTIFYPSSVKRKKERKQYSELAWMGRYAGGAGWCVSAVDQLIV